MIYTENYREHLYLTPLMEEDIENFYDKSQFKYNPTRGLTGLAIFGAYGPNYNKDGFHSWDKTKQDEYNRDVQTHNDYVTGKNDDYIGSLNHRYNMAKKYGKFYTDASAGDIADSDFFTFGGKDGEKNAEAMADHLNEIISQAKTAPKSWIGKKIKSLRNLYLKWLHNKRLNHRMGKADFIDKILEMIGNAIDWLLRKLQNFAG